VFGEAAFPACTCQPHGQQTLCIECLVLCRAQAEDIPAEKADIPAVARCSGVDESPKFAILMENVVNSHKLGRTSPLYVRTVGIVSPPRSRLPAGPKHRVDLLSREIGDFTAIIGIQRFAGKRNLLPGRNLDLSVPRCNDESRASLTPWIIRGCSGSP